MSTLRSMRFETIGDDLVMTRLIGAPRALVFKAWTDPDLMARWWGPHGVTNPVCGMDVRPGGRWRIVMRTPEGMEYVLKGAYREVLEPARLVCTANWEEHPAEWQDLFARSRPAGSGGPGREAVWTVTFDEWRGRTLLVIRNRFATRGDLEAMLAIGMPDGWAQSLERLDLYFAQGLKAAS